QQSYRSITFTGGKEYKLGSSQQFISGSGKSERSTDGRRPDLFTGARGHKLASCCQCSLWTRSGECDECGSLNHYFDKRWQESSSGNRFPKPTGSRCN